MANIRTGSIVSDIRGKVGSEIYSRNRGGAYVKAYAAPVQPDTPLQTGQRARITAAVNAWQGLSDHERMLWNNLANDPATQDVIELKGKRSGYNLFVARRINLALIGATANPFPANAKEQHHQDIVISTLNSTSFVVTRTNHPINSRVVAIRYVSGPYSPGVMSINSVRLPLRGLSFGSSNANSTLTANWQSTFGDLSNYVGMRVFVKWRSILQNFDIPGASADIRAGIPISPWKWTSAIIQP